MMKLDTRNARARWERDHHANQESSMRLDGLALSVALTSLVVSLLTMIYALGY